MIVDFETDELVAMIGALQSRHLKESAKRPLMDKLVAAYQEAARLSVTRQEDA